MNRIFKIIELVDEITEEDIADAKRLLEEQAADVSPFMGTPAYQQKLAKYNKAVLDAVITLQAVQADEPKEEANAKDENLYCPMIVVDDSKWIDNWAESPDPYKEDEYLVKTYDGTVTLAKWVFPLVPAVEERAVCDWEERFCEDVAYWQENPLRRDMQKVETICQRCPMEGIRVEEIKTIEETVEITRELRPCLAAGEKGYFHLWEQWAGVIAPSIMVGGHNGGQIGGVRAIVELADGSIHHYTPGEIKFTDVEEDET